MLDQARTKALMVLFEGSRYRPYDDRTGEPVKLPRGHTLTIGIGRNIQDRDLWQDEVDLMFSNDLSSGSRELTSYVAGFSRLSPVRQAALISLWWQQGLPNLKKRFGTFIVAMAASRYEQAADLLLHSDWGDEFTYRAKVTSEMIRTNTWPTELRTQ